MARPRVEKRLQNIEQGIDDIKEKLCKIDPCPPENEDVAAETSDEE